MNRTQREFPEGVFDLGHSLIQELYNVGCLLQNRDYDEITKLYGTTGVSIMVGLLDTILSELTGVTDE